MVPSYFFVEFRRLRAGALGRRLGFWSQIACGRASCRCGLRAAVEAQRSQDSLRGLTIRALGSSRCSRPPDRQSFAAAPSFGKGPLGKILVSKSRKYTSGGLRYRSPVPEIHTLATTGKGPKPKGVSANAISNSRINRRATAASTPDNLLFAYLQLTEVHAIAAVPQVLKRATPARAVIAK